MNSKHLLTIVTVIFISGDFLFSQSSSYDSNTPILVYGTDKYALGVLALNNTGTGPGNTATGKRSLTNNLSGEFNTAIGNGALYWNYNGNQNVAIGHLALAYNNGCSTCFGGDGNTAIGNKALSANTNGSRNVAVGYQTLNNSISGSDNTAIGNEAINTGVNGTTNGFGNDGNTAYGYHSGYYILEGMRNTGFGSESMWADNCNTVGSDNVAFGYRTLFRGKQVSNNYLAPYGDHESNTALGANSMTNCAIVGTNSGDFVASENTAVGYHNLAKIGGGRKNTTIGYDMMPNARGFIDISTSFPINWGCNNVAIGGGPSALTACTEGYENVGIGKVMIGIQYPIENVAVGHGFDQYVNSSAATRANTSRNTSIGLVNFEMQTTGKWNTAIGYGGDCLGGTWNNVTCIGLWARASGNDWIQIGNSNLTCAETENWWNLTSDGRFKFNIKEDIKGLEFIRRLNPVNYTYDKAEDQKFQMEFLPDTIKDLFRNYVDLSNANQRYTGFIAQEVANAGKESGMAYHGACEPENEHQRWALNYCNMVMPLIKTIQEQQTFLAQLKIRSNDLKLKQKSISENGSTYTEVQSDSLFQINFTTHTYSSSQNFSDGSTLIIYKLNGAVAAEIYFATSRSDSKKGLLPAPLSPGIYLYAVLKNNGLVASDKFLIQNEH